MQNILRTHLSIAAFLILIAPALQAQMLLKGKVYDAETKEGLGYATVSAPLASLGTRTDENGFYELRCPRNTTYLTFNIIGYLPDTVWLRSDTVRTLNIGLHQRVNQIKEVTIKPKKYRNKDNPAVELIQQVIAHRDENRVENIETFQEEQYEKILIGLSNIPDKVKNGKALKSWSFALQNSDTTKLEGKDVVPFYLQENLMTFYSRNSPKTAKKYVKATQTVQFPGYIDQDGLNKGLQYLNQDISLYDNYITLLTDQFMSPIANGAPLFYRYYPMDTTVVNGAKIVRLAFYPRNKTDMLLQGDLYVALDSTYPVTRAVFTVNPNINLNWVNTIDLAQEFQRLPSGKWLLSKEDYRLEFGVSQKSLGIYGDRVVTHTSPVVNGPIESDLFDVPEPVIYLPDSESRDTTFWSKTRPSPLSKTEAATYTNMDSIQNTRLFKTTAKALLIAFIGYVPVGKKIEIGPLSTFYAFNPVEGDRIRFGGRTASSLSTRYRIEAYAAYGLKDERWKYSIGGQYALKGSAHNKFPLNMVRANYTKDVRIPGQLFQSVNANSILTSFVRGTNDRFLYTDRAFLQYEREFENHFSYNVGFEHHQLRAGGALSFVPTDANTNPKGYVVTSNAYLQMRYAPGEKFFQSAVDRSIIDYNYIFTARYSKAFSGLFGGQYDFHDVQLGIRKWTLTPPFGFNITAIEAGGIFGKAPYPLLTIHRANQTYFYQNYAYNLMNFMEFISDRYVSLTINQDFYGFFLNKIPLVRKLKLREAATFKILYGTVSKQNQPETGSAPYYFPAYDDGTPITYRFDKRPYMEASVGIGNILRVLRIDLVYRLSYLDHPNINRFGVRGYMVFYF